MPSAPCRARPTAGSTLLGPRCCWRPLGPLLLVVMAMRRRQRRRPPLFVPVICNQEARRGNRRAHQSSQACFLGLQKSIQSIKSIHPNPQAKQHLQLGYGGSDHQRSPPIIITPHVLPARSSESALTPVVVTTQAMCLSCARSGRSFSERPIDRIERGGVFKSIIRGVCVQARLEQEEEASERRNSCVPLRLQCP